MASRVYEVAKVDVVDERPPTELDVRKLACFHEAIHRRARDGQDLCRVLYGHQPHPLTGSVSHMTKILRAALLALRARDPSRIVIRAENRGTLATHDHGHATAAHGLM